MNYQILLFLIMISTFAIGACKKDNTTDKPKEEEQSKVTISLTTNEVTNITKNFAESGVAIQVKGSAIIDEVGICWGTNQSPTTKNQSLAGSNKSENYNNSSNAFDINILYLNPNTTYYVRSYAKYKDSVYYGNELIFITPDTLEFDRQFWVFDDIKDTIIFNASKEEEESRVTLVGLGVELVACEIKFNNALQAPYEYSVVNLGDTLLSLQASIKVLKEGAEWNSIKGDFKIITSNENGKIRVEFENVQMRNLVDDSIVLTSASFLVEQ